MESTKKEKKKDKKKKQESSDSEEEEKVKTKSKPKKEESDEENSGQEDKKEALEIDKRVFPLAQKELQKEILNIVIKAAQLKKIKKGANEATKTLNRGISDLIIIAADAKPLEIVLHLPLLCEDKNVPYVFVDTQKLLGRACGVSRPVIAASILTETPTDLQKNINKVRDAVEQLFI